MMRISIVPFMALVQKDKVPHLFQLQCQIGANARLAGRRSGRYWAFKWAIYILGDFACLNYLKRLHSGGRVGTHCNERDFPRFTVAYLPLSNIVNTEMRSLSQDDNILTSCRIFSLKLYCNGDSWLGAVQELLKSSTFDPMPVSTDPVKFWHVRLTKEQEEEEEPNL